MALSFLGPVPGLGAETSPRSASPTRLRSLKVKKRLKKIPVQSEMCTISSKTVRTVGGTRTKHERRKDGSRDWTCARPPRQGDERGCGTPTVRCGRWKTPARIIWTGRNTVPTFCAVSCSEMKARGQFPSSAWKQPPVPHQRACSPAISLFLSPSTQTLISLPSLPSSLSPSFIQFNFKLYTGRQAKRVAPWLPGTKPSHYTAN